MFKLNVFIFTKSAWQSMSFKILNKQTYIDNRYLLNLLHCTDVWRNSFYFIIILWISFFLVSPIWLPIKVSKNIFYTLMKIKVKFLHPSSLSFSITSWERQTVGRCLGCSGPGLGWTATSPESCCTSQLARGAERKWNLKLNWNLKQLPISN